MHYLGWDRNDVASLLPQTSTANQFATILIEPATASPKAVIVEVELSNVKIRVFIGK